MTYTLIYKTCATIKDAEKARKNLPDSVRSSRVEYSSTSASYLVIIGESLEREKIVDMQQEFFKAGVSCFVKVSK